MSKSIEYTLENGLLFTKYHDEYLNSGIKKQNKYHMNRLYTKYKQYYDLSMSKTREFIHSSYDINQAAFYSILYNISESFLSLIKSYLQVLTNEACSLSIRVIIESILHYNVLFEKHNYSYIENYCKHLDILEYDAINEYFNKVRNEKVNEFNTNRYNDSLQYFVSKYPKVDSKKFKMRNSWMLGLIKENDIPSYNVLLKHFDSGNLTDINYKFALLDVVHLNKQINCLELYDLIKKLDLEVKKILKNDLASLSLKNHNQLIIDESFRFCPPEIKHFYNNGTVEKNEAYKYLLKEPYYTDLKTYYQYELKTYIGNNREMFDFTEELLNKLFDKYSITNESKLYNLLVDMEFDKSLGFQNQFKLKFRFLLEFAMNIFFNKKAASSYIANMSEYLSVIYEDKFSKDIIMMLYKESFNFAHSGMFTYIGEFSKDTDNIIEYESVTFDFFRRVLIYNCSDDFYIQETNNFINKVQIHISKSRKMATKLIY